MAECGRRAEFMILVGCVLPALCSELCCLPAPPKFTIRQPPRPPGSLHVHCEVEEKRSSSLGMVLGLVTGFVMLLLVVLLSCIFMKRKQIKYHIEEDSDVEPKSNMLDNYKDRKWLWKNGCNSSKKLVNFFKGVQHGNGSVSNTSSESGYCEDVIENQDSNNGEKAVVMRQSKAPRLRSANTRSTAMTDATPDIIASTQKDPLDDTPKRWSMFGLLPSLKPVLIYRPEEAENDESPSCDDHTDLNNFHMEYPNKRDAPSPNMVKGKNNSDKTAVELCPLAWSAQSKDDHVPSSTPDNVGYRNSKVCIPGGGRPSSTDV